ncbi:MAG: ABC transporter permease, partial [Bacillota bacterium]
SQGALYKGYYYWVLEPSVLLMLTGLGFAMLGFALDRVFNPRLRGQ